MIVGGNPDKVVHIVVWSLSRFTRVEADDFVVEKRTLARVGVTIVSATEAIERSWTRREESRPKRPRKPAKDELPKPGPRSERREP